MAATLLPAASQAQPLWQAVSAGMTVEDVQKAYPDAEPLAADPKHTLRSGATGLLLLRHIDIIGRAFTATFFFLGNKLTQVSLSHEGGEDSRAVLALFEELTAALRAKYGTEVHRKITRGLGITGIAQWSSGRTSVSLFASFSSELGMVNIAYSDHLAKASDKL